MPDDKKGSDEQKDQDATIHGGAEQGALGDSGTKADEINDGISKLDRWKAYLDTRKQFVDCEFKTSQEFEKIMLTWPAGLIAGSLTIFWHIDGTILWIMCLYACWFFEFSALALMLGSMIARQLVFRQLIAELDENYEEFLAGRLSMAPENPWKRKTQLAEWSSIVALILGGIFLFVFSSINAPASSNPLPKITPSQALPLP